MQDSLAVNEVVAAPNVAGAVGYVVAQINVIRLCEVALDRVSGGRNEQVDTDHDICARSRCPACCCLAVDADANRIRDGRDAAHTVMALVHETDSEVKARERRADGPSRLIGTAHPGERYSANEPGAHVLRWGTMRGHQMENRITATTVADWLACGERDRDGACHLGSAQTVIGAVSRSEL
jgi:hypothetical protein